MHVRHWQIICALSLLILAVGPLARAAQVLSWEDCLRESEAKNPALLSEQAKVKQAEAAKGVSESGLYPQISASGSAGKSQSSGQDESTSYSLGLSGRQLLFDGLGSFAEAGAADAALRSARFRLQNVQAEVWSTVRTAFTDLLEAQKLVNLTASIASRRQDNRNLVKLRYRAGREHEGSVLTAEADLAQAQFEMQQAGRRVQLAQRKLAQALGRDEFQPLEVSADFRVLYSYGEKPDLTILSDQTPSVEQLRAQEQVAQYNVQSAYASFYPQLSLNASTGLSDTQWPLEESRWSVGLDLSFPIFQGFKRLGQTNSAEASLIQAQEALRAGRISAGYNLESAWKNLEDAQGELAVREKYLQAAQTRAKIANAQYSTGLISFDDWSIIEDRLVSAEKAYLSAQANLLTAEAQWIQSKGGIERHD